MSVLPSDDRSISVDDKSSRSESPSRLRSNLVGVIFLTLSAGVMTGWLYLIVKAMWAFINWLSF
jgi:hypothetical protein